MIPPRVFLKKGFRRPVLNRIRSRAVQNKAAMILVTTLEVSR